MEQTKVADLTQQELFNLIKRAVIEAMTEVNRQQATARADQIAARLLKG